MDTLFLWPLLLWFAHGHKLLQEKKNLQQDFSFHDQPNLGLFLRRLAVNLDGHGLSMLFKAQSSCLSQK